MSSFRATFSLVAEFIISPSWQNSLIFTQFAHYFAEQEKNDKKHLSMCTYTWKVKNRNLQSLFTYVCRVFRVFRRKMRFWQNSLNSQNWQNSVNLVILASPKHDPFTIENSENIPHSGQNSDFCRLAVVCRPVGRCWLASPPVRAPSGVSMRRPSCARYMPSYNSVGTGKGRPRRVKRVEGRHHPLSTGARRATSASRGAERSAAPTN